MTKSDLRQYFLYPFFLALLTLFIPVENTLFFIGVWLSAGILAYVFCKAKTVDFFFYTIFAASVIIWGLVLLMIGAVYLPNKFGLCFGDFVPVTILVGALHAAVAIVYVMFFTFFEWIFNDKKK